MKKVRKIFAIIMTLAMIMGLGMTAFAETAPQENVDETNGKITVKNLTKEPTTVKIYKIIEFENGVWDSVNDGYDSYINYNDEDSVTVQWADLEGYIEEHSISASDEKTENDGEIVFDNLGIGAYLVVATGTTTSYTVMGSFTYGYDSNHLMVPTDVTIDAKGSNYPVTKEFADGSEQFVGLGDTVTYNIRTVFPSFAETVTGREFWIEDQPTGLQITDIDVYVGNMSTPIDDSNYTFTDGADTPQSITLPHIGNVRINFTSNYIGTVNEHAGNSVKVVVTAKVVSLDSDGQFKNEAKTNKASSPSTPVTGDTGSMTIRKVDNAGNLLKGAVFNIAIKNSSNLKFVKESDGVYRLALDTDAAANKTEDLVATNGTLTIKGLDDAVYSIVEKTAPEGYQIVDVNTLISESQRTISAGANKDITIDVTNTKLASLPSTGGIGTTIFTIGGIVIMIGAAGLFFANRRKSNTK